MKMRLCGSVSLAAVFLALAVGAARPQGFLTKKDWKEWSESDCSGLLRESPWAQTGSFGRVFRTIQSPGLEGGAPDMFITAQFRSALPIRQALTRLMLIRNKYDKADPQQRRGRSRLARNRSRREKAKGTYKSLVAVCESVA
jgi:hypothetical protein